jgi:voltage-gated potassium channel
MVVLLLGSVVLAFWYETLDPATQGTLVGVVEWVDLGLAVFFVAEWALRVMRSTPHSGRYAATHAWELLGMIPVLLPLPSFLRALRLVRLVRILRVFGVVGRRLGVWERIAKEGNVHILGAVAAIITVVGSTAVWLLERHDNEHLANWGEAVWWGIVTVTTVGYGDITPATAPGRFVAAGLMVTGIGIIALLASTLASVLVRPVPPPDMAAVPLPHMLDERAVRAALAGELERLAALHDGGNLTHDEFALAKGVLLGTRRAVRAPDDAGRADAAGAPSDRGDADDPGDRTGSS